MPPAIWASVWSSIPLTPAIYRSPRISIRSRASTLPTPLYGTPSALRNARKISDFLDDAGTWGDVKLNLDNAKALASEIATRSAALEARIDENVENGRWPDESTASLNDRLTHLEQDLLDESQSPAEHWYRHVIYGWNIYSLYDGQPLPSLAEAIRLKDPALVVKETARIENALRRMLAELRQAGG